MTEPEPLQQVNRTYVRHRGRTLSYFGGCDYFRLASHPAVLKALRDGLRRYGLNVAASRLTTGNHTLYLELEKRLAQFFGADAALLTSSGYVTSLVAAQSLARHFSHALLDERAHVALKDAAQLLDCPVLTFKHRDAEDYARALTRCGRGARPIVLTDGMFSHDGSVAPLRAYLKLLPRDGMLLLDDAHGGGTLGKTGKGSVELEGISRTRVVQCVTLSKAFGVYGGAILCSRSLRKRFVERSRMFVGSTPLPLPIVQAALESLRIVGSKPSLRRRLERNTMLIRKLLRQAGFAPPETPGPIVPLHCDHARSIVHLQQALLKGGVLPPLIRYPGAPAGGYFRFVISSEHTQRQLKNLTDVLAPFARDGHRQA